jgi:N-acyl-phosphatidylethanolamine-hydrolysing phospholipase D
MAAPPPHHAGDRFRNPWPDGDRPSGLRTAAWLLSFPFRPRPQSRPTPFRLLDPTLLHPPAGASGDGVRIAWLGHSTFLIQTAGLNVLTDPVFADRASPLRFAGPEREVPLPLAAAALPPVDAIVLSHNHYDHLDLDALAFFHERDRPVIAAPLRLPEHFGAPLADARVVEMDWNQSLTLDGMRLHCTPARHFSARGLLDRNSTLWCSWYLEMQGSGARIYFAGDSGYGPHFAAIAKDLGPPDVVIMPIGAYAPRWLMRPVHVDPAEAVQAFLDMGGGQVGTHLVPSHWGTFRLTDEPLHEPPDLLAQEVASRGLDPAGVHVLPVGGTLEVPVLRSAGSASWRAASGAQRPAAAGPPR